MPPGNRVSRKKKEDLDVTYHKNYKKAAAISDTLYVSQMISARHRDHVYKALLTKVDILGKGGFGYVYKMDMKVKHYPQRGLVAVKCPFNKTRDKVERDILMTITDHPNVVNLYYYFYRKGIVNLVMEYIDSGDLFTFIKEKYKLWDGLGPYVELFAFQMYRGLAYCHSRRIVHRDMKPENLLVNEHTGLLKITDFGCSTHLVDPRMDHINYVGTRDFRAPELIFGATRYNEKVDIWGSAVVLTEMLMGVSIFYGATTTKEQGVCIMEYLGHPSPSDCQDMGIRDREWPKVEKMRRLKAAFSEQTTNRYAVNLLHRTLLYKPSRRPSAWEICVHPFFGGVHRRDVVLPNGRKPKHLFDFTDYEMQSMPSAVQRLLNQLREYMVGAEHHLFPPPNS